MRLALLLLTSSLLGCATQEAVATPKTVMGRVESGQQGSAVVPYADQDSATRESKARLEGYFPNYQLTTHEGEQVRFYEDLVRDRKVLINFMYVDCDGL